MKIFCAWCERDGTPNYLGERAPSENPATTHGICSSHKEQILEGLPSKSFPDVELLIVVRSSDTALYESLSQNFVRMPGVRVIPDQRRADGPVGQRVRHERRIRQGAVSSLGYTVVRFKPKPREAHDTLDKHPPLRNR